jgi:hypothetical protein
LLVCGDAGVDDGLHEAVAVGARHGYSSGTKDVGSAERASAIFRIVRG